MSASSTVTLAQIRQAAQSRADMLNSNFVSTTEWNQFITNSYKELYDLLVSAYGNDYYVASPTTFTTDGTNSRFSLPADFYKLLGADLRVSGRYVNMDQFPFAERNSTGLANPIPQAGQTIQLFYIPEPSNLVNDTDTVDGISGWEEYVIIDAAIKALSKEESDVSVLAGQKQALVKRLESMAENRDAGTPSRVVDVYTRMRKSSVRYRLFGNQIWLIQGPTTAYDFDPDSGQGWTY